MIPLEYLLASSTRENLSDSPPKNLIEFFSHVNTPATAILASLSCLFLVKATKRNREAVACSHWWPTQPTRNHVFVVILLGWSVFSVDGYCHPFETYLSTWESSQIEVNMKRVWNHHLGFAWLNKNKPNIFTIEMTKGDMETRIQVRRFIGNLIPPRPLKRS